MIQPDQKLIRAREEVSRAFEAMEISVDRALSDRGKSIRNLSLLLHSLSPDATVKRGFSLTMDAAGMPVTSVASLKKGDRLKTRLSDGEVESVVE